MSTLSIDVPVSRNFLIAGSGFLVVGLAVGMYMGASGDHRLGASHAHLNLVGFVLSAVFGLVYKAYPAMTAGHWATLHFWLHLLGALLLNLMLFLLLAGLITEAAMVPIAPIAELMVGAGVIVFATLVLRRAT